MFINSKLIATCLSLLILASVPAVGAPDLNVAPTSKSWAEPISTGNARFAINVAGRTPSVNQSIEISGPAEDIKLRLADGLDFSSIKALSSSLISPGMADEGKSWLPLWQASSMGTLKIEVSTDQTQRGVYMQIKKGIVF